MAVARCSDCFSVMLDYLECVKRPVQFQCGARAWPVVHEVIVRPTQRAMPQCHIMSMSGARPAIGTAHCAFALTNAFMAIMMNHH